MRVAFTGHRPDKLGGFGPNNHTRTRVKASIKVELEHLLAEHPDLRVISGMALGVDQWAAEVCIELKIPFIAAVPCEGQDNLWSGPTQQHYRELLEHADEVHLVTQGPYASWKMHKRNQWMVDNCDHLIAVWDGSGGGTANCVAYAKQKERLITRLVW
jgi:uncharacterized phage-like protein YoqJ